MTDAPEKIWAFYAPEIEEDNPQCTIVAGEHCMHGAQEYIRADAIAKHVKVRPLVWDKHPDLEEYYGGSQDELTGLNEYVILPEPCAIGWFVLDVMGCRCDEDFRSVSEAKAAAEAHHEARIREALE